MLIPKRAMCWNMHGLGCSLNLRQAGMNDYSRYVLPPQKFTNLIWCEAYVQMTIVLLHVSVHSASEIWIGTCALGKLRVLSHKLSCDLFALPALHPWPWPFSAFYQLLVRSNEPKWYRNPLTFRMWLDQGSPSFFIIGRSELVEAHQLQRFSRSNGWHGQR